MTPKRFMVIAGEPSGDVLAAELVRELRAEMFRRYQYSTDLQPLHADLAPRFFGAGGPCMAKAGVELAFDLTRHSLIGFPGPAAYLKLRKLRDQLVALACEREPHAIICVDFQGFNSAFAAAVKKYVRARRGTFNNWEPRIIKYISPQVWASRADRAYKIARDFDLVLSIIPFEKEWYAKKVPKLRVEFVGHPMIDRYRNIPRPAIADASNNSSPLIALLPGSRRKEFERHFPVMLEAFAKIRAELSGAEAVAVFPTQALAEMARAHLSAQPSLKVKVQVGGLPDVLGRAAIAISKTGTITMECAYFGVPAVTLYRVSWLEYQVGKRIVKVKFATMPNLLANEPIYPEFIHNAATPENIAHAALEILRDPQRRETVRAKLVEIIASLGPPGASHRAAQAILNVMGKE
jgi:lipid-A-disaccharide synthase